jgi:hypothetical protein
MVLLNGGGASMPKSLRPAAILLQLAALVPFGGRTALLLTLAMAALWMVPRVLHMLRGARLSLPAFAAIAALAPLLVLGVGLVAVGGFFDVITDRLPTTAAAPRRASKCSRSSISSRRTKSSSAQAAT